MLTEKFIIGRTSKTCAFQNNVNCKKKILLHHYFTSIIHSPLAALRKPLIIILGKNLIESI